MAWGVERVGDEGLVSRSGWWGGRERRRHRFQVKVKHPRHQALTATPSVASTLRAVPMIVLDVTRFDIAPPEDVTPLVPPLLAMMSFCMVRT